MHSWKHFLKRLHRFSPTNTCTLEETKWILNAGMYTLINYKLLLQQQCIFGGPKNQNNYYELSHQLFPVIYIIESIVQSCLHLLLYACKCRENLILNLISSYNITQYRLNQTICRQTTYNFILFMKMSFKNYISTPKNGKNSSKIKMKCYYKNLASEDTTLPILWVGGADSKKSPKVL